uniref:Cytochrome b n=1 Tax=Paracercomonas marina TaxID=372086 RepID=A0A0B5GSB7_9EUKA|nr:apocytochrome b [Paracercomonas marina]AJF22835.1 apocytochrome b [Paracercomonas marina]
MRFIRMKSLSVINAHLIDYPTPVVGYMSSFGSLSGLCLVIQIVTGILLVAHYTPHVTLAFTSVEHIMRDVNDGWLFRYYHSNGASIFFLCVYLHINQNFSSDADDLLWLSGLALYLAIMAAAFMGYILPWGQMSFWGATVITNLFAAIPMVGQDIAQWLWGGFSVDNPTLNRFFSFHYMLPFIIAALVILHLSLLHLDESSNEDDEYVEFYYYYFIKDLFAFFLLMIIFAYLVFFNPNYLSHPDNYIMASISVTPAHLVPEWYFLPFYGVLRSTPDKFGGLLLMFGTIVDLFLIDTLFDETGEEEEDVEAIDLDSDDMDSEIEDDEETANLLILFFLGGSDIDEPYTDLATIITLLQFLEYFEIDIEDEDED